MVKEPSRLGLNSNNLLKYSLEVFPNKSIKKSLAFFPDTYTIDIKFDFSEIKDMIYRDVRFSWSGGLATTEKDSIDDKTYFKTFVYQGGELEDLKVKEGQRESKKLIGSTDWGAIRTKYFVSALIPNTPETIRFVELFVYRIECNNLDQNLLLGCLLKKVCGGVQLLEVISKMAGQNKKR